MSNTRSNNNYRSSRGRAASQRTGNKRKKQQEDYRLLLLGGIVVVILAAMIFVINRKKEETPGSTEAASDIEETIDDTVLQAEHIIDMSGIPGFSSNAKIILNPGMDRGDIVKEAHRLYDWNMVILNSDAKVGNVVKPTVAQDETTGIGSGDNADGSVGQEGEIAALTEITVENSIAVPDIIEAELYDLLDTVFADDAVNFKDRKNKKKAEAESDSEMPENASIYIMTLNGVQDIIDNLVQDADDMWYVEAKGGSIDHYDPENDSFVMEGSSDGCEIDRDKLRSDLEAAFGKGAYKSSIPVSVLKIPAESSVKNGDYQVIGKYVTKTTSNSIRNKNIQLACQTLNGTIIRPGEEFSYNQVIGQRTVERGFGEAAAYANGEVVQEVGGGVCQLSSTLYNAITESGLKTTYRSPHTFKPTYVTPGQDATVSWGGPDYRFANVIALPDISYDTTYAIGIKSRYADQTVTVEIYGRPVLRPGYSVTMESEMVDETEVPRVMITPEMAAEGKTPTTGDKGSHWKTYLLINKDGQQVSRDLYHNTAYKGHTEYFLDPESTSESVSESETESSEAETEPYTGPIGPGMPSQAQTTSAVPATSPAETTAGNSSPGPQNETGSSSPGSGNNSPGEGSNPSGGGVNVVDVPGGPGSETQGALTPGDPGFIIQEGP